MKIMEQKPGMFRTPVVLVFWLLIAALMFLFATSWLSGQGWMAFGWFVSAALIASGLGRIDPPRE